MDDIGFKVTGDRNVTLRFDEFPRSLHDRFLAAIRSITSRLQSAIEAAAPKKTGRLAGSVEERVFDDSPSRVRGWVSVDQDFAKAAALEYGSHKRITAKTPERGGFFARRFASPTAKAASSYQRTTDITATRFLRGPLERMESEITDELRAVVDDAIAEGL